MSPLVLREGFKDHSYNTNNPLTVSTVTHPAGQSDHYILNAEKTCRKEKCTFQIHE